MERNRTISGITNVPMFEGVPVDCPTVSAMRQTYRTLRWLAENYESPGGAEYEALMEGARTMVACAFEIYQVHLDSEFEADRRRRYP
jgi:hypothetical protein